MFKYYADFLGFGQKIQSGEYKLKRSMTIGAIADMLTTGEGKVIDSMKSWPRDADAAAHRQKLIEMLQRAGLLDTGKPQPASTNQGSASIKR